MASVAGVDRGDRDGVVSSSDPGPTPVARQTIVVGAVAAILGLAGGWLLGGAGVTDPQPPDDAQVASATTIADVDSSGPGEPTLEPIDTVARTTTSRPQRTVTTLLDKLGSESEDRSSAETVRPGRKSCVPPSSLR